MLMWVLPTRYTDFIWDKLTGISGGGKSPEKLKAG
jgi:hypothetical protein